MSTVSNTKLKSNEPDEKVYVRQLKSSSALSFARSLFHAAEGKELFQDGFIFCQRSLDLLFAIPFGRNVDASALLAADPNRRSPYWNPQVVEDKWREGHKNGSAVSSPYRPGPAQDFPWFRQARVSAVLNVERPHAESIES